MNEKFKMLLLLLQNDLLVMLELQLPKLISITRKCCLECDLFFLDISTNKIKNCFK